MSKQIITVNILQFKKALKRAYDIIMKNEDRQYRDITNHAFFRVLPKTQMLQCVSTEGHMVVMSDIAIESGSKIPQLYLGAGTLIDIITYLDQYKKTKSAQISVDGDTIKVVPKTSVLMGEEPPFTVENLTEKFESGTFDSTFKRMYEYVAMVADKMVAVDKETVKQYKEEVKKVKGVFDNKYAFEIEDKKVSVNARRGWRILQTMDNEFSIGYHTDNSGQRPLHMLFTADALTRILCIAEIE